MISLTRDIKQSFLNLTNSKAGAPVDSLEPETLAFQSKVLSDGGKILDIEKLDNFYKANKAIGKYNALQFAVSKQFGYKLDASGNIIKIYDASKNGNDLDISRGTVPEDLSNDMFFLNNVFFKDETVTFDTIGDKFTLTTDINHPNPDLNNYNYVMGFSDLWIQIGGGAFNGSICYVKASLTQRFRSAIGSFNNINDANIIRKIDFRHEKSVNQQIRKDGEVLGVHSNSTNLTDFPATVSKIVFGGQTTEALDLDADCYLNDSFFYNEYLTDQQLEDINSI